MPRRKITDAELGKLKRYNAEGLSLNASARALARPVSTVRDAAVRLGLSWDRTKTAVAVAAAQTDMAARRAALAQDLLADAERIREQMWQSTTVYSFGGKENDYSEHAFNEAPADIKRTLMQTATTALTAHLRLVDHAAKDSHDDARDVVLQFGIAVRAAQLPGDAPAPDG